MTDLRDETYKDTSEDDCEEPRQLREDEDYYLDDGLMVFTAAFLKRRGYCCESGCRHCPYGYVRVD